MTVDVRWVTAAPAGCNWADRIMAACSPVSGGCWEWNGRLDRNGYGKFEAIVDGKPRTIGAHRAAWLAFRGELPYPLMIDHLCRNRACVNPDHLDPVTNRINAVRSIQAAGPGRRGRPPRGLEGCGTHGFSDGYRAKIKRTDGWRWVCRTCADGARARWRRKHASASE